jgi:DNA-binding Lrp family transcriptional regulator
MRNTPVCAIPTRVCLFAWTAPRVHVHPSQGAVVTKKKEHSTASSAAASPSARWERAVGVRLAGHARADVVAFERAVVALPEVRQTYHVVGNYDYTLHVEVPDLPAYEDFHANRLADLPGVAAVSSNVTMQTLARSPTS